MQQRQASQGHGKSSETQTYRDKSNRLNAMKAPNSYNETATPKKIKVCRES
jgi:hypothetical protein